MKKYIIFVIILLTMILTACSNKKSGETKTDFTSEAEIKSFTIFGKWQYVVTDSSWIEWENSPPSFWVNSDMSACFTGPFSDQIGEMEQTDTYRFVFIPKLAYGEGEIWDISDDEKEVYIYDPTIDRLIYRDRAFIKVEELGRKPYTFLPLVNFTAIETFNGENYYITVNYTPQTARSGKLNSLEFEFKGNDHLLKPPDNLDPIIFELNRVSTSVGDFNWDGYMDVRFRRAWATDGKEDVDDTYIYNPKTMSYAYDTTYSKPWAGTSHQVNVTKSFKGEPFNMWVTYTTVGKNKNHLTEITMRYDNWNFSFTTPQNIPFIFTMNNSPEDPFDVNLITVDDFNFDGLMDLEFKGDNSNWRQHYKGNHEFSSTP